MIKEKAYAKVNLFLNVLGKRIDGYHNLEMVMAPLRLHDLLTFEKREDNEIQINTNKSIVDKVEDNIVYKVANFMKEEFSIEQGVTITIEKNIPLAGGLAGGSADAAATLRGLNKLWKLKLSLTDMAKLGVEFGADIPFCVYNKLAIARGVGEDLTFLKHKLKQHVLVVNPNIEVSTKEVFSKFDTSTIEEKSLFDLEEAIKDKNNLGIAKGMYNALEKVTFEMHPQIRTLKNCLIDSGLEAVLMSGSGATVFAISKNKKKITNIQKELDKKHYNILTKFL